MLDEDILGYGTTNVTLGTLSVWASQSSQSLSNISNRIMTSTLLTTATFQIQDTNFPRPPVRMPSPRISKSQKKGQMSISPRVTQCPNSPCHPTPPPELFCIDTNLRWMLLHLSHGHLQLFTSPPVLARFSYLRYFNLNSKSQNPEISVTSKSNVASARSTLPNERTGRN